MQIADLSVMNLDRLNGTPIRIPQLPIRNHLTCLAKSCKNAAAKNPIQIIPVSSNRRVSGRLR
jgi:hypothetical protein